MNDAKHATPPRLKAETHRGTKEGRGRGRGWLQPAGFEMRMGPHVAARHGASQTRPPNSRDSRFPSHVERRLQVANKSRQTAGTSVRLIPLSASLIDRQLPENRKQSKPKTQIPGSGVSVATFLTGPSSPGNVRNTYRSGRVRRRRRRHYRRLDPRPLKPSSIFFPDPASLLREGWAQSGGVLSTLRCFVRPDKAPRSRGLCVRPSYASARSCWLSLQESAILTGLLRYPETGALRRRLLVPWCWHGV